MRGDGGALAAQPGARARRAAELQPQGIFAFAAKTERGVVDAGQPVGDLEPEGDGHRALQQGAAQHRRCGGAPGKKRQRRLQTRQLARYQSATGPGLQHQHRIGDILAGRAQMNFPLQALVAHGPAQMRHQRDRQGSGMGGLDRQHFGVQRQLGAGDDDARRFVLAQQALGGLRLRQRRLEGKRMLDGRGVAKNLKHFGAAGGQVADQSGHITQQSKKTVSPAPCRTMSKR